MFNKSKEERVTDGAKLGIILIIVQILCFIIFGFEFSPFTFYLELALSVFLISNYNSYIANDEYRKYSKSAKEIHTFLSNQSHDNKEDTEAPKLVLITSENIDYAPEILQIRNDDVLRRIGFVFMIIDTLLELVYLFIIWNPSNVVDWISLTMIGIFTVLNLFNYIGIYRKVSNIRFAYMETAVPILIARTLNMFQKQELDHYEVVNKNINTMNENKENPNNE